MATLGPELEVEAEEPQMVGTQMDPVEMRISDEELCALALAADPDAPLAEDAVPFTQLVGAPADGPLPSWYMPAAAGGRLLTGWRRLPPALIVASLLVINGCGLCITYGKLGLT